MDGRDYQAAGTGQARCLQSQNRIPRQVEGLFEDADRAERIFRECAGRTAIRIGQRLGEDQQADRQLRMWHDSAYGKRLTETTTPRHHDHGSYYNICILLSLSRRASVT